MKNLRQFGNGNLPVGFLRPIGIDDHRLVDFVAGDFIQMNTQIEAAGLKLELKHSYVSCDLADLLGTTEDNGWGIAFSLRFSTSLLAIDWLKENAFRFHFANYGKDYYHWYSFNGG